MIYNYKVLSMSKKIKTLIYRNIIYFKANSNTLFLLIHHIENYFLFLNLKVLIRSFISDRDTIKHELGS